MEIQEIDNASIVATIEVGDVHDIIEIMDMHCKLTVEEYYNGLHSIMKRWTQ